MPGTVPWYNWLYFVLQKYLVATNSMTRRTVGINAVILSIKPTNKLTKLKSAVIIDKHPVINPR